MAIHKTAGSKIYIGPQINPDTINAMSDYDAVNTFEAISEDQWVEIEEVEDMGEHGDSSEAITFTAVGNRRVRKLKGPRDAGTKNIVVGRDPLDDGQVALIAADGSDLNYAFKVTHADARAENFTDSVEYFAGLVMSRRVQQGQVNTVTRRTFPIAINTGIYEVSSAEISA
jgi:hypothetical protein